MAFLSRIVTQGLRLYWRATRGIMLEAEACIVDPENRIALVEAGAANTWHLPKTGVRNGEALADALRRFLRTDYRIHADGDPELFWIYNDGAPKTGGLTGLYIVRQWHQDVMTGASGLLFFGLDALPPGLADHDAARIRQAVLGRAPFEVC
jgi:ADP-ribose pyrophosphatase YjhB (NUDIX family)